MGDHDLPEVEVPDFASHRDRLWLGAAAGALMLLVGLGCTALWLLGPSFVTRIEERGAAVIPEDLERFMLEATLVKAGAVFGCVLGVLLLRACLGRLRRG